jgi:uncharacterized protein (TIRG00374 family)
MNKYIIKMAQIIAACVLVALLIVRVDWIDVLTQIIGMRMGFVGAFVAFYIAGIVISAWKWCRIAQISGFEHSYFFYLRTYVLGTFLNNFFPSFVGGDAYRTFALARGNRRRADSFATIVIDRVSGLFVIVVLMLLYSAIRYDILYAVPMLSIIYLVTAVGMLSALFAVVAWRQGKLRSLMSMVPKRLVRYLAVISRYDLRRILRPSIVYATAFSFVGIAFANYMLFIAIGAEISFADFISVIFLTNVIASLPVSVGNIGTKEWAYVFLFGLFGVAGSTAVAIVLLSRVLQMVVSFAALPLYIHEKASLKKI